jgi:hypothetical protein
MVDELLWENNVGGGQARLSRKLKFKTSSLALKQVAIAKMVEVSLISGEFYSIPIVFEPSVWILIETGTSVDFFGVYKPSFPIEENTEEGPSLCLRKSSWNKFKSQEEFNLSENKRDYILGSSHIYSRTIFTNPSKNHDIELLITDVITKVRQGLKFKDVNRSRVQWQDIRFGVADGSLDYTISYTPYSSKCEYIESWICKWCKCFELLNHNKEFHPDSNTFRISYHLSLFERIEMFCGK